VEDGMTVLLETRNVSKSYGAFRALEQVSMAVHQGELVAVGAQGADGVADHGDRQDHEHHDGDTKDLFDGNAPAGFEHQPGDDEQRPERREGSDGDPRLEPAGEREQRLEEQRRFHALPEH